MLNLSKNTLRSIVKKGTISDYKSMSKKKLINAINISKPRKNYKNNIFKSKRKEIKDSFTKTSKKKILKSKREEIKEILHDSIINKDKKI